MFIYSQLCNRHPNQGRFHFCHPEGSLCIFPVSTLPHKGSHYSDSSTIVLLVLELHVSGIIYYALSCFWLFLFNIMSEIHPWVNTIINLYFTDVDNRIRKFK